MDLHESTVPLSGTPGCKRSELEFQRDRGNVREEPQTEAGVFPEGGCLHRVLKSFAVSYVIKFSFSTSSKDFNEDRHYFSRPLD